MNMNYTIYLNGEIELMTRFLTTAVLVAYGLKCNYNILIVDNSTGEVVREYLADGG